MINDVVLTVMGIAFGLLISLLYYRRTENKKVKDIYALIELWGPYDSISFVRNKVALNYDRIRFVVKGEISPFIVARAIRLYEERNFYNPPLNNFQ